MPHSVSPEAQEPDAEPMATDVEANQDASEHEEEDEDHDMAMIETGDEATAAVGYSAPAAAVEKQEVKLEDLFADVESDEEFPSSNAQGIKMSSSPEAPASPMSVFRSVLLPFAKLIYSTETWARPQDLLIQKLCGPSTSAYSPGDICFNGLTILQYHPMTLDIASLHLHYKTMRICATSPSLRQTCE
jgi:hypothetical protein